MKSFRAVVTIGQKRNVQTSQQNVW